MRLPQRLLAFFLSFALIFSSTSALATTSVGGWTALDTITAGANNTINATKTAGGKVLKSAVAVAPSAVKVGKHLIKGGGQAALAYAVVELLGEGIDWLLDPANNAVKYKTVSDTPLDSVPKGAFENFELRWNDTRKKWTRGALSYDSPDVGCASGTNTAYKYVGFKYKTSDSVACYYASISNPAIPPAPSENWETIPINTVAAQVISNAEAGHAPSQEAVKATALEGFAAGEHDAALDAAAVESDAGTENPPDTENPPKDPNAPAEPFDPSSIIAAINSLKALLAGILSSITSLSDWFKADPEQKDNEVDIPDVPLPEPNTDISFGGSCPADLSVNFNLYGTSTDFVLMPFSKFCPLLSTFVKPTLIVLGSFFAVSIVGGRRDE